MVWEHILSFLVGTRNLRCYFAINEIVFAVILWPTFDLPFKYRQIVEMLGNVMIEMIFQVDRF